MPRSPSIPSMRDKVSAAEWATRVDLAACYRLIELYGMTDMIANHVSARVPDEEGAFLINPYGMFYEEITASSLIKVDFAGDIVAKPDFSALAFSINGAAILYGNFLNALIAFVLIAAAVYFFVVVPVNSYTARMKRGEKPADPSSKKCPECLSEIPIAARKCAFCGSLVTTAGGGMGSA